MDMKFLSPSDITPDLQNQLGNLYSQLNSQLTQLSLHDILDGSGQTEIVACFINNTLAGIAMMAKYKVVSGYKGMIEDVVVSHEHRGKGIGRSLMEHLLERGKNLELTEILLFSGHHRKVAIHLYKSLGFKLKDSGLYVLKIV